MKRFIFTLLLACAATPVVAADIGVSINIGEPNFYGRLDIGDFPHPQLIRLRPVLVERVAVTREPLYLRVPPGHAKNWRKHCHEYDACGRQVYFVDDRWYHEEYAPRYRERHADREEHRDERRDERRDEHRDDGQDHDRGHGDDNDHGHRDDHEGKHRD